MRQPGADCDGVALGCGFKRNVERLVISLLSDAAVSSDFDDVKKVHFRVKEGAVCLELDGKPFECLTREGHVTPPTTPVKKKARGAGKPKLAVSSRGSPIAPVASSSRRTAVAGWKRIHIASMQKRPRACAAPTTSRA